MTLPAKVIHNGQTKDVSGYVGTKYRFSDGTTAPMTHCAIYVEPIEDTSTVRSGPKDLIAEMAAPGNDGIIKTDQPKERKGGRPRKIKAAE